MHLSLFQYATFFSHNKLDLKMTSKFLNVVLHKEAFQPFSSKCLVIIACVWIISLSSFNDLALNHRASQIHLSIFTFGVFYSRL